MITSRLFRKTLLIVLGIFVIIVLASSLFSIQVLRQQMIDEYLSKAHSIVSSISMSVPDVFLERDAASIQSIIDQYMQVEGVGYVFVQDIEGQIIAHTFSPEIPYEVMSYHSTESITYQQQYQWTNIDGDVFLEVSGAVLLGRGGYIHIGMERSVIDRKIFSALMKIQSFNLAIFILCIVAIYYFMKRISQPLGRLTDYARRLRDRDLDFEIAIDSNDEIGELAGTMEGMRSELSRYVHRLKTAVHDATEELQQVLTYLSSIMDNMADGLVVLDEEGRIIRYNASFKDMFSIDEHNLIEQKVSNHVGVDPVQEYHAVADGEHLRQEFFFEDARKGKIFIEASVSIVSMTCGISYIVIFHDITSRKNMELELKSLYTDMEKKVMNRTEELVLVNENLSEEVRRRKNAEIELQAEKEFFAVTLKSIGDAVLTTDRKGHLEFINRVGEEILQMALHDCKGLHFRDVFTLYDTLGNALDPFEKVMSTRKIAEKSRGVFLSGKAGGEHSISFKISPIYDRQSQILGTVMVFQDISHILHLEEERLRKDKLESIGILAGGIAHDFNNILTAILNHILMVKVTMESGDDNYGKLESAQKACLRARRLTQQLLTFSKGGAPIREATSMAELIEDTVAFTLRGSNVISSLDIPCNLWPANVDPGQISQVLENLVINAVQSMPAGGHIWISVNNETIDSHEDTLLPAGKYLKISIRDSGCGIKPEHVKRVFDPYFTTKKRGTGLGLATTYSIVKNHNGHIDIVSEVDKGTEFVVYLPAMTSPFKAESTSPVQFCKRGSGKVLVLDDDEEILDVMKEVLDLLGYNPVLVADGGEVLKEYEQAVRDNDPFDLVIMDLTIPGGMGGLETMQKLKEIYPDVRAVVSSGYSQDTVMANYREHGFAGVLAKPYTIDELGTLLSKLLK